MELIEVIRPSLANVLKFVRPISSSSLNHINSKSRIAMAPGQNPQPKIPIDKISRGQKPPWTIPDGHNPHGQNPPSAETFITLNI